MTLPRIFVSIPAYRDRECQWTLRDMFERARHPERVFAGVCWQTFPGDDDDCFEIRPHPAQVRAVHFHASEARGLGWARAEAQALWQGEEYSLQIDSHMRFVEGWDELMLDLLAACDSPDPVLTLYPPAYQLPDTRKPFGRACVQMILRFEANGLLRFKVADVPDGSAADRPLATAATAGAFIFGSSRILRDVPSDPELYFNGEEQNLAVRLWTAGFDLFSPHIPVMFHYYSRKDSSRHWNDAGARDTMLRHDRTLRRMRLLCEPGSFESGEVAELGRYGLGTRRSLAEYEAFAGVNFAARSIAVEARRYPFVRPTAMRAALPLRPSLRPAPGAQLFVIGEDAVLFNEKKANLQRLNHAAARIWCALEEGWPWERIAADMVDSRGITREAAMAELRELASHWIGEEVLQDELAGSPSGPRLDASQFAFRSHAYRLLDTVVSLRFGDDALETLIHPAFAHLEVEAQVTPPVTRLTIFSLLDWYYIFEGDQLLLLADTPRKLVPKLKVEVMERAIARHDHVLHLHSAAVMLDEHLILLPGASGSGKTVLTASLLAQGATYFSDEVVLLRRDGTVRPMPSALSVKRGAIPLLAARFPHSAELPEHDREDGLPVRYLPPPATSLGSPANTQRPALIIFPKYAPHGGRKLRRLAAAEALGRLLDECVAIPQRLTAETVATIIEVVDRAPCWELVVDDLDDALRQIMDLVGGRDVRRTPFSVERPSRLDMNPDARLYTKY